MSAPNGYEPKPLDPPEKSLKYMAWSIKEIAGEFKKVTALLEKQNAILESMAQKAPAHKYEQGAIPF